MRFTTLARRLGVAALLTGAVLCGCKSSSTTSNEPEKTTPGPSSDKPADTVDLAQAKRISINNLLQIGLAFHNFHANMGHFPSPGLPKGSTIKPTGFHAHFSWRVNLLPYIEQDKLYKLVVQQPMAPLPDAVTSSDVKTYQIPYGQDKATSTHYRVFVGDDTAFEYGRHRTFYDFQHGLHNTILVVEAAEAVSWSSVDELAYDPKEPLPKLGVFPGGFHALMGDGEVRWIPSDTPEKTIRAMITWAGDEAIELPGMSVSKQR